MGKLICASNANNVLTDFIRTGTYNKNRPFHTVYVSGLTQASAVKQIKMPVVPVWLNSRHEANGFTGPSPSVNGSYCCASAA